jgi:hypothetical protein
MRVPGRDWLYAIGDVNGRALLTHVGNYQALIAVAAICNREASMDWDGALSPRVVLTEPQIAAVEHALQQHWRPASRPAASTPTPPASPPPAPRARQLRWGRGSSSTNGVR